MIVVKSIQEIYLRRGNMRGKSYHMNFTDFRDVDRKYVSQGL